jgi:hypothetical protein
VSAIRAVSQGKNLLRKSHQKTARYLIVNATSAANKDKILQSERYFILGQSLLPVADLGTEEQLSLDAFEGSILLGNAVRENPTFLSA